VNPYQGRGKYSYTSNQVAEDVLLLFKVANGRPRGWLSVSGLGKHLPPEPSAGREVACLALKWETSPAAGGQVFMPLPCTLAPRGAAEEKGSGVLMGVPVKPKPCAGERAQASSADRPSSWGLLKAQQLNAGRSQAESAAASILSCLFIVSLSHYNRDSTGSKREGHLFISPRHPLNLG
jgi:hypothetical protein